MQASYFRFSLCTKAHCRPQTPFHIRRMFAIPDACRQYSRYAVLCSKQLIYYASCLAYPPYRPSLSARPTGPQLKAGGPKDRERLLVCVCGGGFLSPLAARQRCSIPAVSGVVPVPHGLCRIFYAHHDGLSLRLCVTRVAVKIAA